MTTYTIAAELLQELRDYLQRQCGQRCNAEYNPCEAQELDEGLRTLQPNTQESRCANCGKSASEAEHCLSDYPEDGEWFCSPQCKDQHDELGCPHLTHDGHRHPVEAHRLIHCENALRSLASWLGNGGYNAPTVEAKVFESKIRDGVEALVSGYKLPTHQAPQKPLTDAFAKAASEHGLTLVITTDGYKLVKCGPVTAHGVKP